MASECNQINMKMVEDDHMIFRSYNLSSWKGMCRYFSGDSDCIPNMNLVKYSSNIEELAAADGAFDWMHTLDEYTIISGDTMTSWEDAKEMLQICEMKKNQHSKCDSIDKYLVFANEMSGDWNTKTKRSKCAEIGYLLGIKCQNSSDDTECEPVDCPNLLNNTDPSYHAAGEFCRELGCGKTARNVAKCNFLNFFGTYTVHESWNDSYGLVNMENKCKNEYSLDELVLDFSHYDTTTYNFTLNDPSGDENLCIVPDDIDLADGKDSKEHCQLIGAQKGVFTKYTSGPNQIEPVSCREKRSDEVVECDTVKFTLPNFITNKEITSEFIPTPSVLKSEDDFGVKLCGKLNCRGNRNVDEVTCAPCDCGDHGNCSTGTCECDIGWSGENCDIFDFECVTVDCNGHGNCSAGNCTCNNGWIGDNCETFDFCVDVDCNGQGNCSAGTCTCNNGWIGDNCEIFDFCVDVDCNGQGNCSAGICECNNGYLGDNCEVFDPKCVTVDCNGHGNCSAGICTCNNGWIGDNCEIFVFDSCVDVDCNGHGNCSAGICTCDNGYLGDNCEIFDFCVDVDCNGQGTCADGTCECNNGYLGDNCEIDNSFCEGNLCNGHGTCADGSCTCDKGWTGDNCKSASQAVIQFGMALLAIAALF